MNSLYNYSLFYFNIDTEYFPINITPLYVSNDTIIL